MRRILFLWPLLLLGPPAHAELEIKGISGDLEQNVRAFVELGREACDAPQWRVNRRFRAATRQAASALEPYGYYNPDVRAELAFGERCWTATLAIRPGPRVTYRHVDVRVSGDATDDPGFTGYEQPLGLQSGKPLVHQAYENFKEMLQVRAAERGYIEARFTESSFEIWPDELAADVRLQFESGPRYRFGDVRIAQSGLDERLIQRYLDLPYDEPYDGRKLTDAYRALSNSGYFSRILVTPEYDEAADGRIPISVDLQPGDRIEYNIGAGYATDTGMRFRLGVRNRRVNTEGHRLDADLRYSKVRTGILAEYRKPLRNPRTEWMSYTGAIESETTDTSESDLIRAGVRRSRQFAPNWLRTASLDVNYESFLIGTVDDNSLLVLPAIAFDNKEADQDLHPTHGRRLGLELRGTHRAIGSSTNFLQVVGRARFIRSFGTDSRLIARGTIGFTAKEEFDALPPSVRFFAGGDESIRGFNYKSLGPLDQDGNVVGGSNLLVASLEYERRLKGEFFGAVFVDGGNAFDGTEVDPAYGAGLGIKWRSPIGQLRFYLAHPLNKSDDSIKIHVSLGADL